MGAQQFVQQQPAHIAASKQQVSVQHSWLHQAAELSVINVQVHGLAAATVAMLTAAVVFPACYTGAVIPDLADHVGLTSLLPMLLEYIQKKAALLHQWLKKIQNLHNGAAVDTINMHIL